MPPTLPLPGALIWIRQRRWRVERVRRFRSVVRLDVADRGDQMTFLAPFDRAARDGERRTLRHVRPQQALARVAGVAGRTHGWRTLRSLVAAKIDLLPHQLEPALAAHAAARRILIADEVGLGKTIQAGIVIAETLARESSARVLVIAPGALRDQWERELADRFGIAATLADRDGLDALARQGAFGDNPWTRAGVWLTSIDFLKQPHVFDALPHQPWDVVVIDEAHSVCGESARFEVSERLGRQARCLLLLTATPHSGDAERFERLAQLGRLPGDPALTVFRRTRAELGLRVDRAVRWLRVPLSLTERRALAALMAYEASVLAAAGEPERSGALLLLSVFRKRALSTMAALKSSIARRLAWLDGHLADERDRWLQPRLAFDDVDDEYSASERAALTADVGMEAGAERAWLTRLAVLAADAAAFETKACTIERLIARTSEAVVVFTEFRDSLQMVASRFTPGVRTAMLHGGMTRDARRAELARFLGGEARILVATDVAGQGLNLHTRARWVVNLELPWTPTRLEQRAGRVDRIGQRRRVHVTSIVASGDAESDLVRHLAHRVLTAQRSLGADVFADIAPSEESVRAALIAQARSPARPLVPFVAVSTRGRRSAVAIARRAIEARTLVARWRHHEPVGAVWTRRRRGRAALLVFSVAFIARSGDTVERHVIGVRVEGLARTDTRFDDALEAARAAARQQLHVRHKVVSTRLRRLARLRVDIEQAIADELLAHVTPAETQNGLFDRAAARHYEELTSTRADIVQATRARIAHLDESAILEIGPAELVAAWVLP